MQWPTRIGGMEASEKNSYRLPTEAEWEYAARSGTMTAFAHGDEITTEQANFNGKATQIMLGDPNLGLVHRGKPVPVNQLEAENLWGLRHMSGNVSEHTLSCWTNTYEGWDSSSAYLKMSLLPNCELRVIRGGAYWAAMDFSRVAFRGRGAENARSTAFGFRVVRDLFLNN